MKRKSFERCFNGNNIRTDVVRILSFYLLCSQEKKNVKHAKRHFVVVNLCFSLFFFKYPSRKSSELQLNMSKSISVSSIQNYHFRFRVLEDRRYRNVFGHYKFPRWSVPLLICSARTFRK